MGIHYLLEAVPADVNVEIVGRILDRHYFEYLSSQAKGRSVNFVPHPDFKHLGLY